MRGTQTERRSCNAVGYVPDIPYYRQGCMVQIIMCLCLRSDKYREPGCGKDQRGPEDHISNVVPDKYPVVEDISHLPYRLQSEPGCDGFAYRYYKPPFIDVLGLDIGKKLHRGDVKHKHAHDQNIYPGIEFFPE